MGRQRDGGQPRNRICIISLDFAKAPVYRALRLTGAHMAIATKDEVRAVLSPYHGVIRKIILEAWAEWREVQALRVKAGMAPVLYSRTVSNYVFDAIARRAIPLLGAEEKINVDSDSQTFRFYLRGLAARIKKGGDDRLGSSIPTQAALSFEEADGVIAGLPPETAKIEVIWLPNEIGTQIANILVVARDGDTLIWEYEMNDPASGASVVEIAPPSDSPHGTPTGDDLVKPKAQPDAEPGKQ